MHTRVLVAQIMATVYQSEGCTIEEAFATAKQIVKRCRKGIDEEGRFEDERGFDPTAEPPAEKRRKERAAEKKAGRR